jgi:protein-tyrosine phosphatase
MSIPVRDFCPPTIAQLGEFVDTVERLPAGTKVVVHCQGGSGRTGTFAAAHWIAKGMTASAAIAHIRQARPHAIETPEQEAVLEEFARKQFGR